MHRDCVLLPGLHGTAALWTHFLRVAPSWARPFPVVLPTIGPQTPAELAHRVLSKLTTHAAPIVIAESFSGPLAIRLAADIEPPPELLVLVNTFVVAPFGHLPRLLPASMLGASIPGRRRLVARLMAGGERRLAQEVVEAVDEVPRGCLRSRLAALAAIDEREALARIEAPILVLRGDADRLIGAGSTERIGELRPDAVIVSLPAPHLLLQLVPERAWEEIGGNVIDVA